MSSSKEPSHPKFSIIVPTYNEASNVAVLWWLIKEALDKLPSVTYEVVFVDDASPDGTAEVVRALQKASSNTVRLCCRHAKLGLGSAYSAGLECSRGAHIILMDADLSHHPRYLPEMIRMQLSTGADIVAGTRYKHGGGVAGWNLIRKITSRGANLLASTLLGARVSDLTGAFRLYSREALKTLLVETRSKGYAFQMEVIVRAQYKGFRIVELPIIFVDRLFGESKLGAGEYVQFLTGLARLALTL